MYKRQVVETYFCFEAVGTTYPMDGAFHLTVGSGQTSLGIRVIFAIYFGDFTGVVLLAAGTLHDVRVLQTYLLLSLIHILNAVWKRI